MAQGSARTQLDGGLTRAPLIGLLAELDLLPAPAAVPAFTDGLGGWLGWADAPRLHAALNLAVDSPLADPVRAAAALARETARLQQAESTLRQAITDEARPPARSGVQRRATVPDPGRFRQRYTQLQQTMERTLAPLRSPLRGLLAGLSPQGAGLAAIDAALEPVLQGHEHSQLAVLPLLLERRIERLCEAHGADEAVWLPGLRDELQRLLLAELDLRLQPLHGLLAAAQAQLPTTAGPAAKNESMR
jgi:hypothetical protein